MALCCIFVPSTVLLCRAIKEDRVHFFGIMIMICQKFFHIIFCSLFSRLFPLLQYPSSLSSPHHSVVLVLSSSLFLLYPVLTILSSLYSFVTFSSSQMTTTRALKASTSTNSAEQNTSGRCSMLAPSQNAGKY